MPAADRLRRIGPVVDGRLFVRADYGQIEPRILLSLLRGRGLIAWDAGADLYRDLIGGGDRDSAKVAVNKVINGGRPDPGAAGRLAEFIAAAESYRAELARAAREAGFVATLAGRAIPLSPGEPNHGGKAVNRVVQGTAADVFNRAAAGVARALEAECLPAAVAFLLFDELWVECDPSAAARVEAVVRAEMGAAAATDGLTIPVRFDVGAAHAKL
jgi:DNA polymerase-1